ncbi:MAG: tetratricopeptide repeat protein [Candidatus Accumulibacter sp.]|uniref:tetratricopeptide repeat protein n=1 Tax=Accumulibacter sp. TaxID=2053492 RepID=UPI0019F37180|nr:tetratricopeptide repeat protein [Accumulibacter sp.]MBE2258597.1 tetratricopeptide repeat protein [Paracoccaceae bacterium]MCP5249518.1 tetratricopeptide repeat protein [Accumulibacter sp.]
MIDALFDLFGNFYQSGNLAQAEWIARSILQAIPDDVVSLQLLGLVYYRTKRRKEAMQAFGAAEIDPGAQAAVDGGGLRASTQCLRAASGRGSTLAGAWYELGLLLFRLGRYPQALGALQAALSARPDFAAARRAIARVAAFAAHRKAFARRPQAASAPDTRSSTGKPPGKPNKQP